MTLAFTTSVFRQLLKLPGIIRFALRLPQSLTRKGYDWMATIKLKETRGRKSLASLPRAFVVSLEFA